ncbi:MAG TPA: CDP-alcohol phosphatidyltransferase family protein [Steroidobacteraceae bacterium]|nr:CDP-alcohol phosphatidyltransferase family protein [Steroidobacteraceae bacterium]
MGTTGLDKKMQDKLRRVLQWNLLERFTRLGNKICVTLRWNLLERVARGVSDGDPTFQGSRDFLLRPIAKCCIAIGLTADVISLLGLFFATLATYAIYLKMPVFAIGLLGSSLALDGLDGVVARLMKQTTAKGEIVDVACDTLGTLLILIGLTGAGYISIGDTVSYALVLTLYTACSSGKGKILAGKYQSIGSRVAFAVYVILWLVIFACSGESIYLPAFRFGVLAIALVLLGNLGWDLIGSLMRLNSMRRDAQSERI